MTPRNSIARCIFGVFWFIPVVCGHGQIHHVVGNGVTNNGPNIYYAGDAVNDKTVTRVMYQAGKQAYVLPSGFNDNSRMSCEGSASASGAAPDTLTVQAGGSLDVYWVGATGELAGKPGTGGLSAYNPWVHAMGPIQDYITSCDGDCSKFDATNAGWTKIAGSGLDMTQTISDGLRETMKGKPEQYWPTQGSGLWAIAKLVQNGSKWTIKIPSSLKGGEYIVRHELSAVHNPLKSSDATTGPQLYIACIQVKVTGGGSASLPVGTQAKDLYEPDSAFAKYNVYSSPTAVSFSLPGPAVWDGVDFGSDSNSSNETSSTQLNATTTRAVVVSTQISSSASITSSANGTVSTGRCQKRRSLRRRLHNLPAHRQLSDH